MTKFLDLYDLLFINSWGTGYLISWGLSFKGLAIWLEKSLKSKSKTRLSKDKVLLK